MDNTIIVALISAGGSVLVAITALVVNHRGFALLDARLSVMQSDLKARLQDKVRQ